MNRILIPLDGSAFSYQIFAHIIKLVSPKDNELVLLRLVPYPTGMTGAPPRPMSVDVTTPLYNSGTDIEYASHPIYASQELESLESETLEALDEEARPLRTAGYSV